MVWNVIKTLPDLSGTGLSLSVSLFDGHFGMQPINKVLLFLYLRREDYFYKVWSRRQVHSCRFDGPKPTDIWAPKLPIGHP
jgi:hypothetical protein